MGDTLCRKIFHMFRQMLSVQLRLQPRNQAFENHRGLSGTGYPGHHGKPALRDVHLQRLYRMDAVGGKMQFSKGKQFLWCDRLTDAQILCLCEKWSDHGVFIGNDLWNTALCDHISTARSGFRSHLNHPVRLR